MSPDPVLAERLIAALGPAPSITLPQRDIRLPGARKAHAVIGMRGGEDHVPSTGSSPPP
jgi:hypothetical protein